MTDARLYAEGAEVLIRTTPYPPTYANLYAEGAEVLLKRQKPVVQEPDLELGHKSQKVLIANRGKWESAEAYIANRGYWSKTSSAHLAYNGFWHTAHVPAPTVLQFGIVKNPSAPWSRISYRLSLAGDWNEVRLYYMLPNRQQRFISWADPGDTLDIPPTELPEKYIPGDTYWFELKYIAEGMSEFKTLRRVQHTMAQPPVPTAFSEKLPITYATGGVQWPEYRDVDDWQSRNNTLGTMWNHGGNLPYVYYYQGLQPSIKYLFQTRAQVSGQWGEWSDNFGFQTAARPWVPGSYNLVPNGDSHTYQSGGPQSTRWQNAENRDSWYGGNCNNCYTNPSSRGFQRTVFHYQQDSTWNQLRDWITHGATITRAEVFIPRANTENGLVAAMRPKIALNGNYFPTPPWNVSGNIEGPLIARGQSVWCDIPTHWAHHILMGSAAVPTRGVLVGDVNDIASYIQMYKAAGAGVLRVTIA